MEKKIIPAAMWNVDSTEKGRSMEKVNRQLADLLVSWIWEVMGEEMRMIIVRIDLESKIAVFLPMERFSIQG